VPRLSRLCGAAIVALALVAVLPAGAGAAQRPLPVPYTLAAGVAASVLHPGAPPPGANDFSCRPTAAHPDPVVLVHGLIGNMTSNWPTMSPLLKNNGYCVFALTYGTAPELGFPLGTLGGLRPIELSAQTLSAFVDRVLAATGASEVDVVGHSEGTIMADYYAKFLGGAAKIGRFVGIAGLYHGTNVAGLARLEPLARRLGVTAPLDRYCQACIDVLDNSPFVAKLNSGPGGAAVRGVTYTNIMTRYDELVVPYTSGMLDAANATNIVVQAGCKLDFSDHLSIVAERNTARHMLNALDPEHARPVGCTPVLPVVG
jgi:triacylglycerol esterase/lipase EstA (alpha/beta hydrolase family)